MIIALQGKRDIMGKLIFGKNGQVHFNNENEKQEAIEYLLTSDNVDFDVHGRIIKRQGAWGPEERIHFKSEDGVPDCLKRLMTAGMTRTLLGRINCKEFCKNYAKRQKKRTISRVKKVINE